MTSWPILESLPSGYGVIEGSVGVLAVLESLRSDVLGAGFGPDGGESLEASDLSGRTRLLQFPLADGSRAVVRRFTHGGLLRVATGERYGDPQRPFKELILSARLRSEGLPTPEVLAARAIRMHPFGWQLALITRRVEGVKDLAVLMEARRAGQGQLAGWRRSVDAVGELIGRLHCSGFVHADLHPRNLLLSVEALEGADPAAQVIDLDRSRFVPGLASRTRRRNLLRFARAVRRREDRGAPFLTRGDSLRFLRAYGAGLRSTGNPAPTWREDWRRIRAYGGAAGWLHGLGWTLEKVLGRGPEARDGEAQVSRKNRG
ncbi:MAG: hypothetical protein ACI8QS_000320 [Planctomycetota bacterium]|jgi:hypothetical protein